MLVGNDTFFAPYQYFCKYMDIFWEAPNKNTFFNYERSYKISVDTTANKYIVPNVMPRLC